MEVHTSMNASAASDVTATMLSPSMNASATLNATTTMSSPHPDLFLPILNTAGLILLILLSLAAAVILSYFIPTASYWILGQHIEQSNKFESSAWIFGIIISICVITQFANPPDTTFEFAVKNWKVLYGVVLISCAVLALCGICRLGAMALARRRTKQPACDTSDVEDLEENAPKTHDTADVEDQEEKKTPGADTGLLDEAEDLDSNPTATKHSDAGVPGTSIGAPWTLLLAVVVLASLSTAMSFGPWSPFKPTNLAAVRLSAILFANTLLFIIVNLLVMLSTGLTAVFAGMIINSNPDRESLTEDVLLVGLTLGLVVGMFLEMGFWCFSLIDTEHHPDISIHWRIAQLVLLFLLLEGGVLVSVTVGKGVCLVWRRLGKEKETSVETPRSLATAEV